MLANSIIAHPIVQAIINHPIVQGCANIELGNSVVVNEIIANEMAPNTVADQTTAYAVGVDEELIGQVKAIQIFATYIGPIILIGLIGNYMVNGDILPLYFAYGGLVMEVVMSMLASAYAITKIVDAAVKNSVSGSYYYTYRSDNTLGNYMGMWELLNVIVFLTWSMVLMILGLYMGSQIWAGFEALSAEGKLTKLAGFKYLLLSFITAAGIWIGGLTTGDMSSSMLGIFDSYNTKVEAINSDGDKDQKGTALLIDIGVHLIETYVTMSVIQSIVIYAVGWLFELA